LFLLHFLAALKKKIPTDGSAPRSPAYGDASSSFVNREPPLRNVKDEQGKGRTLPSLQAPERHERHF
jgi:hypothetical protein